MLLFLPTVAGQSLDTVRFVFIGDVMAHLPQTNAAARHGYDSYYKHIQKYIDRADIAVANMEEPLAVAPYSGYPTFSAPAALAEATKRAGFDVLLAANNHICDKGRVGLDSTRAVYNRMKVTYTGFFRDSVEEEMDNPPLLNVKGLNVAFVNFTYGLNGFKAPAPWRVNLMDSTEVKRLIAKARERGADFVIALPHWGEEYHLEYSQSQKQWAERMYGWGVDMVVGTHPHVVQAVEYEKGRLTAYSLGNYISNMSVAYGQIGLLLSVEVIVYDHFIIKVAPPQCTYLWCAKPGTFDDNYTVFPITEYECRPEAFRSRDQYNKMMTEWSGLKKKFKIE